MAKCYPHKYDLTKKMRQNREKSISLHIGSKTESSEGKKFVDWTKIEKKYDTNGIRWGLAWTNFNTSRD